MNNQIGDRAVVLGASMAGLLAAHVLAESYGQVIVIERDELPETSMHRRGIPHGRHLHALAARGQQALEELFPGLTAELVADGAKAGSLLADARMYLSSHRLRQTDTGLVLLCASRPFLEAHIRARVRAHPNVALLDLCDVVGLATTPDNRRVTGVRVLRRADSSAEEVLLADLVIDASGRGSRTPTWLDSLGYARPDRGAGADRAGLRHPDLPASDRCLNGDLAILDAATPQLPRTGALLALEGDRWMVTLAGILGDHRPPTPTVSSTSPGRSGFPDIYEAIRDAEPLDDPVSFRFPASVRHHYERLRALSCGPARNRAMPCAASTDLRPGHERGCAGGAHVAKSPRPGDRSRSPSAGSVTSLALSMCRGTWQRAATWLFPASRDVKRSRFAC